MVFGLALLFSFPLALAADLPPDASAREQQREDVKTPVQSGQGRQIGTDLPPTKVKGHRIFMDDSEPAIVSEVVVQDDRTGRRMRMPIEDFNLRYGFLPYDEKHCTGVLPDGQVFRCQIDEPQDTGKADYFDQFIDKPHRKTELPPASGTRKERKKKFDPDAWLAANAQYAPAAPPPARAAAAGDPFAEFLARYAANEAYEREIYQRVVEDERREEDARKAIAKKADAERSHEQRRNTWVMVGIGAAALVGLVLAVLLLLRLVRAFSFAIATGVDAARKRAKKD